MVTSLNLDSRGQGQKGLGITAHDIKLVLLPNREYWSAQCTKLGFVSFFDIWIPRSEEQCIFIYNMMKLLE